jgi:hypothetical protein
MKLSGIEIAFERITPKQQGGEIIPAKFCDALLTQHFPISALEAGRNIPAELEHHNLVSWVNPFTGQPAASLPVGLFAEGTPVGLQSRHAACIGIAAVSRRLPAVGGLLWQEQTNDFFEASRWSRPALVRCIRGNIAGSCRHARLGRGRAVNFPSR